MNGPAPIGIVGFGGCTSLGFSIGPTLAAMGAGLSNFTDSGIRTPFDTPVSAAALLEQGMPRSERLRTLASIALVDLGSLLATAGIADVPLLLGVPPDLDPQEETILREELEKSTIVQSTSGWFPHGRASTFAALAAASDLILRGVHPLVAVGGIDSLCSVDTVYRLMQFGRVLGPHTEGTIPGEAAVFTLLTRRNNVEVAQASRVFGLEAVELHRSPVPFDQRDRVSADDLAAVFRAFREKGAGRVDRVIAAHSGEGYFGRTFSHAYLREVEVMPEPLKVDLIADCVGDVGAAAGLLGLAFATYRAGAEPSSGGRALVYSESDTGEIGAAIIDGAPAAEGQELVA